MKPAGMPDQHAAATTLSNRIVVVGDAGDDLSSVLSLLREAGHRVVHYDPRVPLLALDARPGAAEVALGELDCGAALAAVVVGDFALDPSARTLTVGTRRFPLTPRQFLVMRALMRSPERTLSREELCREAGIRSAKATARGRSLDMQIVQLRKFIEADTSRPRHILTARQIGYRFVPVATPAIAHYPRRIAQPD